MGVPFSARRNPGENKLRLPTATNIKAWGGARRDPRSGNTNLIVAESDKQNGHISVRIEGKREEYEILVPTSFPCTASIVTKMAKRPVFVPIGQPEHLVDEIEVEFVWNPGFAATQKKKNVFAMHSAAQLKGLSPLLEVSTKSLDLLGQRLSAFNLTIETSLGKISVESAFQGSKVFEGGGPFVDIYTKDSRDAKKDTRLIDSGRLIAFEFFGQEWPLVPKTAFYDWLYLTALFPYKEFLTRLYIYKGFTDIEFNPGKSLNCQARTCALLVSLLRLDALENALSSQSEFIKIVQPDSLLKNHSADLRQRVLPDIPKT